MKFVERLFKSLIKDVHGQATIEMALVLPLLLGLTFNTVNFGYFFLMAVNLSAAPRSGALYSILGFATPSGPGLPTTADVNTLTLGDLTGAVYNAASAQVQVCTAQKGTTSTPPIVTLCDQFNGFTASTPPEDPESGSPFLLNQVDIIYTFTPLIDRRLFNLILLGTPYCSSSGTVTCTFHRKVLMRAMN
jgi:Flp pilus assembly protein TadG